MNVPGMNCHPGKMGPGDSRNHRHAGFRCVTTAHHCNAKCQQRRARRRSDLVANNKQRVRGARQRRPAVRCASCTHQATASDDYELIYVQPAFVTSRTNWLYVRIGQREDDDVGFGMAAALSAQRTHPTALR